MSSTINATTTSGVAITGDTSGSLALQTNNGNTAVTIDTSQNVGIGTSSPSFPLQVQKSGDSRIAVVSSSGSAVTQYSINGGGGYYYTYLNSGGNFVFQDNATERMRIDSSGNLLVGTATSNAPYLDGRICSIAPSGKPAITLQNDNGGGQFVASIWGTATSGNNIFLNFLTETSPTVRGSINYNRGAGLVVYNTTSDRRLKENIVDAPSALSKLNSVQIRSFDWKETGNHSDFGVIAQELELVAPECVTQGLDNEDGSMKSPWAVDTSALVPAMIKAIQELNAKVVELESKLNAK